MHSDKFQEGANTNPRGATQRKYRESQLPRGWDKSTTAPRNKPWLGIYDCIL